jgi:hypothetical protein
LTALALAWNFIQGKKAIFRINAAKSCVAYSCPASRISRPQLAGGIFGDDAGKTAKGPGAEGLQLFKGIGGCAADFLKAPACKPCGSKTGLIVELACAADGMSKSAGAMFNFRGYCGDSQAKRGSRPTCRLFIAGFAELRHESTHAGTALNKHWIFYESIFADTPAAFLLVPRQERGVQLQSCEEDESSTSFFRIKARQ